MNNNNLMPTDTLTKREELLMLLKLATSQRMILTKQMNEFFLEIEAEIKENPSITPEKEKKFCERFCSDHEFASQYIMCNEKEAELGELIIKIKDEYYAIIAENSDSINKLQTV